MDLKQALKTPGSVLKHLAKATIGEIRSFNDDVSKMKLLMTTQMLTLATEYNRYPRDDSDKTKKEFKLNLNDSKLRRIKMVTKEFCWGKVAKTMCKYKCYVSISNFISKLIFCNFGSLLILVLMSMKGQLGRRTMMRTVPMRFQLLTRMRLDQPEVEMDNLIHVQERGRIKLPPPKHSSVPIRAHPFHLLYIPIFCNHLISHDSVDGDDSKTTTEAKSVHAVRPRIKCID